MPIYFLGIFLGHVLASGLKILTSKKVLQKRESQSPFASMSSLASSCRCFMDEGLTFQKLKFRLNFDIIADFFPNGGERVANFIVSHLCARSFVALKGM